MELNQGFRGRATEDCSFVVRAWKDEGLCARCVETLLGLLSIVTVVNVSNRKLLNMEWFMCIKSNGCFSSLTLVSDCSWVLHYTIYCVNLVASTTRKEYTIRVADWITGSVNRRNPDVRFKMLLVANPITG